MIRVAKVNLPQPPLHRLLAYCKFRTHPRPDD